MANKQAGRGQWNKDKQDRGPFKRGGRYYVRFADQHGRLRVESTGAPSRAFAQKILDWFRGRVAASLTRQEIAAKLAECARWGLPRNVCAPNPNALSNA